MSSNNPKLDIADIIPYTACKTGGIAAIPLKYWAEINKWINK